MPTVRFQNQAVLLALLALPVLALLWHLARARARRAWIELAGPGDDQAARPAPDRANARRGALRLAALALLVIGLAGPVAFRAGQLSPALVPVVFVLDVSSSMRAPDVPPDRLGAARHAVEAICSLLPDARTALVAAADDAAVACPLTADRNAFLSLLDQATGAWMGRGGTQLARALHAVGDLVARDGGGPAVVVLLSDGEDHGEPPDQALAALRDRGIVTHTVVTGSILGADLSGLPAADGRPEAVRTAARPEQMALWASQGGGRAWAVSPERALLPRTAAEVVPPTMPFRAAMNAGVGAPLAFLFYALAAVLAAAGALQKP